MTGEAFYLGLWGPALITPAAWYRFNRGITVTGSGVSQWDDASGNARHLLQGTDANRPPKQSDGSILFDGATDLLTAAFTLIQPETVYLLMRHVTWRAASFFLDSGNLTSYQMSGMQDKTGGAGTSPAVTQFAGSYGGNNLTNMTLGQYHVYCAVYNGASSLVQIDTNAADTGNVGAGNGGGITLGRNAGGDDLAANVQIKEAIVFSSAHNAATRTQVAQYLATL